MPELMQIVPAPESHVHVRLVLESFDSSEECSFEHWVQVCRLVDDDVEVADEINQLLMAESELAAWN